MKLKTLQPRIKTLNTFRVKPLKRNANRVTGRRLQATRLAVYSRDGGRCCLCGCVVALPNTQMDHRLALQFGGVDESSNLWTLCIPCHDTKTSIERRTSQPLPEAMEAPEPRPVESNPNRFNIA